MLNSVEQQGRFVRDPELRYTPQGTAVVDFSLAVQGMKKDDVTFVSCTAWDKTAETIAKYMKKGGELIIQGSLKNDTWEDRTTGKKQTRMKVKVFAIHFTQRVKSNDNVADSSEQQPNDQDFATNYESIDDGDVPF